jgi:hypothetical protein
MSFFILKNVMLSAKLLPLQQIIEAVEAAKEDQRSKQVLAGFTGGVIKKQNGAMARP